MAPLPSSRTGAQTGSEAFGLNTCCLLQTHLKLDQPLPRASPLFMCKFIYENDCSWNEFKYRRNSNDKMFLYG